MPSERMSIRASSRQPVSRLNKKDYIESVNRLVTQTTDSLHAVWAEAGYEEGECQMLLGDIFIKFKGICDAELIAEQQILDHAKVQVHEKMKQYTNLSHQLGRDVKLQANQLGNNYADKLAELERLLGVIMIEVSERENLLNGEMSQIEGLVQSLGEPFPPSDAFQGPAGTHKLSDVRLNLMKQHKGLLEALKLKRIEEITSLAMECHRNFVDLVICEEGTNTMEDSDLFTNYDAAIITLAESGEFNFNIHKNDVEQLRTRLKNLVMEKEKRRIELSSTGSEIARLWTLLRTPVTEREAFQNSFQMNLSMATLRAGKNELERLRKIRAESLGKVLESIRMDIQAMWTEAGIEDDAERRKEFPLYFEPIETMQDDAVEAHEEYSLKIRARLEELRPILQKIAKREAIISERYELEQIMLNPERLTARGPKARDDRKREEEMQKRVKNLDKINKDLQSQIMIWEEQHGLFVYGGERYSERMHRQEDEYLEYRDSIRNSRKKKDGKGLAEIPVIVTKKKGSTSAGSGLVSNASAPAAAANPFKQPPNMQPPAPATVAPASVAASHTLADKENFSSSRNSTCSEDSGISDLTEIKERASTATIVKNIY